MCHILGAAAWSGCSRKGGIHLCVTERWMHFSAQRLGSLSAYMCVSSRIMSCYFTVWVHFYYLRYAQTLLHSLWWREWEIGGSDDWINHLQISFNQPLDRISHLLVVARLSNPLFLFWGTAVVLLCWQPSGDRVHRERLRVGTGKWKKRQNENSKKCIDNKIWIFNLIRASRPDLGILCPCLTGVRSIVNENNWKSIYTKHTMQLLLVIQQPPTQLLQLQLSQQNIAL